MPRRPRRWVGLEARLLETVMGETDAARAMQRAAWELLDEAEVSQPPFDLAKLASFQGVRMIRSVAMDADGRLVPEGDQLVIEVNETHSVGKQRFSTAHEIAHTLLPGYQRQAVNDAKTGAYAPANEEEALCDIGAATLLLDPRRLRVHAARSTASLATLVRLAELFEASLQATAAQLAALDAWACAFVFWEEGFRKAEQPALGAVMFPEMESYGVPTPKLRVRVTYPAPSFPYFIPWNKSAEPTSIVDRCRESVGSLRAVERVAFGRVPVLLGCESLYAPYTRAGVVQPRVVSLFVPAELLIAKDTAEQIWERL